MAEDTTPAAESTTTDEAPSELVTWKDSEDRKHTGARSGSAYKKHLAEQKLASAAEKAEAAAAKSDDTAETPEVAADVATTDAQNAGDLAAAQGGEPHKAPADFHDVSAGDAKASAAKSGRNRTYGKV
ncbi:hypothetical protein SEA_EWALD_14 [Gordonia phage Ewald]|nr:hypothetical protein SEA_EWALD_14 [Gordonia phage Ewald]